MIFRVYLSSQLRFTPFIVGNVLKFILKFELPFFKETCHECTQFAH